MVYYAPSRLGLELAHLVLRSWEGFDAVVALIQQSEQEALSLLGLPETSIADLLENAGAMAPIVEQLDFRMTGNSSNEHFMLIRSTLTCSRNLKAAYGN